MNFKQQVIIGTIIGLIASFVAFLAYNPFEWQWWVIAISTVVMLCILVVPKLSEYYDKENSDSEKRDRTDP